MKRSYYIFPLMAFTALSLTLAGCDENKTDETAAAEQATTTEQPAAMAPVDTTMADTAPVAATPITASNARAYATAEGATTGAIFLTLNNPNTAPDKLIAVRTTKAPRAEIHESFVDEADGTMQMRQVQGGLDVAPGQPVELKPGGYHIMLFDLAEPLVEGQAFEATLTFQNAGDVVVPVSITAPGASATDAMGAEMTSPTADNHAHDDGAAVTPSTTTDAPATEAPAGMTVDEATPDPTPMPADQSAVPSDEPVTDEPTAQ